MKNIKELILNTTALDVEVLSYEYDNTEDIYFIFASCFNNLCHIELSKDGDHIVIYNDNQLILHMIAHTLYNKKHRYSLMYMNDLQNTPFHFALRCVSEKEYQEAYEEDKKKIKAS